MSLSTQKKIGKILLWIGILAWLPYMYLTYIAGKDISVGPYLTVHLIGVLGSLLARLSMYITKKKQNKTEKAAGTE